MSLHLSTKLRQVAPGLLHFWCPGCNARHGVQVDGHQPGPQWGWNGDAERPTFTPSILVTGNPDIPVCHSFIRDGLIEFCGDSSHSLAGQTVPLPDFPC